MRCSDDNACKNDVEYSEGDKDALELMEDRE